LTPCHTRSQGELHSRFFYFNSLTIIRLTGVGDHGYNGIKDTIANHVCSLTCHGLQLANIPSLKATLSAEKENLDDMDMDSEDELEGSGDKNKDPFSGFILTSEPKASGNAAVSAQ
jgi:hypothetical protein